MSLSYPDTDHALAILIGAIAVVQGIRARTSFIDESQIGASQEDKNEATPAVWKRVIVVGIGVASVGYGVGGLFK